MNKLDRLVRALGVLAILAVLLVPFLTAAPASADGGLSLTACIVYRDDDTQQVHSFTFTSYEEAEANGFVFGEDGSVVLTPGMARGARLVDCGGGSTDPGPKPDLSTLPPPVEVERIEPTGENPSCEAPSKLWTGHVTVQPYVDFILNEAGDAWVPLLGSDTTTTALELTVTLTPEEVEACRPADEVVSWGEYRPDEVPTCDEPVVVQMRVNTWARPILLSDGLTWVPGGGEQYPKSETRTLRLTEEQLAVCPTATVDPTSTVEPSPSTTVTATVTATATVDLSPTATETPPPGPTLPPGGGGTVEPTETATSPSISTQSPDSGSDGDGGNPPSVGGLPNTGSGSSDDGAPWSALAVIAMIVCLAIAWRVRPHSA